MNTYEITLRYLTTDWHTNITAATLADAMFQAQAYLNLVDYELVAIVKQ
jgi:hypothetical protein